ncbi:MAG: ATP-binding protein [Lysobacterales bacterium]
MSASKPFSLTTRLTLAAGIALIAFLGITGLVLDRAFSESARDAVRDRLQGVVFTLLAAAELMPGGELFLPDASPEPRLSRPGSGLYAYVAGDALTWGSSSLVGNFVTWPQAIDVGQSQFMLPNEGANQGMFVLSQGIAWESESGQDVPFTFHAAESVDAYEGQMAEFRRSLWGWLGAASILLLLVQSAVLRWSLRPLRNVAKDLARVQRGETANIEREYPQELAGLTGSINTFIDAERKQLARFRNALADLAHSLKTPLTVMRTALDSQSADNPELLRSQVGRMDDIVGYQLKRARTSGHTTYARPLPISETAEGVVQTLEQAYRDRQIRCDFEIDPKARFFGETGDLSELLGNLLENAFKWCEGQVLLTAVGLPGASRPGLEIRVEDDGPGIDSDQAEKLLQRGVRGDEQVDGHGIGLAVVREMVEAYSATMGIERSNLGGAQVWIRFDGEQSQ